jgi:hypothetical protein
VDQGRRKMAGRKAGEERGLSEIQKKIVSPPTPGEKSPGFFYAWIIINNCWKAQASS